ncbi:BlaI/MecI/CopY family transcriptional regulator [Exilibacterium tricleocarpae]|uniref:BlaI/MecI/CopY family transcriptional regulator n=1 Tax=Exilibacterium tricleocarpae TaxID=2591008 RepID=A0A545TAE0_9GAMM|nr:BlaI/MecI/CopY family transcriptional regulator [Exilibacterium tricleocarpae]TQV74178.1 BlaI/MecI/CopY family transcriptional regulator [Exilibacterium tricleocarpae]
MARKKSEQLTDSEQRIMEILWQRGEASVKEITDTLAQDKETAYTTVQTMCKILAEKEYAGFRKEGRAFIYHPKITRNDAQKGALKTLLNRFFGGSPEVLAQHLLRETDLDFDDLAELQKKIDQADEKGG